MHTGAHSIQALELRALAIRENIITMLEEAGSGHSAGPLGMADVYSALYFNVLNHNPAKPEWPERDRLILSCGHTVPVRYAAMAEAGYFPRKELLTLRKLGTRLHGHPHNLALPGVETSSGPLGQGLSQAIGIALAATMNGEKYRTYCITSDGEHEEGQIWEAVMFAGSKKVANLTNIVDRNFIQIDGPTELIMPLEPFADKYRAFGWHVIEVDGHNIEQIIDACNEAKAVMDRPTVIVAFTIPGKGVGFMEGDFHWHGKPPTHEEASIALKELRTLKGKIRSEHE
ncbi:MAG TPA: transketolase [Verrucomicrobiae bacterium]|nr:transketolase [Verrucomicrobiae bacterium]